ncbi:hypothetical protein BC937DRAFT_95151 [Endogone sp. FLAS-F59071]|nr:hypothetical protein BC937DRAFT_95151 [Endogone sp. FLAS-F59071]|eukprot:RUS13543.1 hypothetical protein BC937DRAFT_95151 [Endogone sp. FLAS-F59071]
MSYERKGRFQYASKADIAKYVSDALDDIIFTMGMSKDIRLHAEIGFRDVRPDIWLINYNGSPVGFIEIKKPSRKIMNDPVVAGQVFDYLKLLESFYGIEFQFGIVSTYVHWRFFWLSGTDAEAQQNIITSKLPSADQSPLLKELPGIPCYDDNVKNLLCIKVIQSSDALQTVEKREVHASRIFTLADKNIILAIVSILYKMVSSPRYKVNVADLSRSYIQLDEKSWHWEGLPKNLSNIKFNKIPRADAKNYICLAYLGSGAEGLVWLATTTGGVGCVVKLAKAIKPISAWKDDQNTESQTRDKMEEEEFNKTLSHLKTEAKHWMSLWGFKAQAKIIGGQPALVMPYIKMCTDDELDNNNEIKAAVNSTIKQMARKGFRHNDLFRRHVGIYWKEGILHALFVDLSDIKEDKEEDAIAYMVKKLKI